MYNRCHGIALSLLGRSSCMPYVLTSKVIGQLVMPHKHVKRNRLSLESALVVEDIVVHVSSMPSSHPDNRPLFYICNRCRLCGGPRAFVKVLPSRVIGQLAMTNIQNTCNRCHCNMFPFGVGEIVRYILRVTSKSSDHWSMPYIHPLPIDCGLFRGVPVCLKPALRSSSA